MLTGIIAAFVLGGSTCAAGVLYVAFKGRTFPVPAFLLGLPLVVVAFVSSLFSDSLLLSLFGQEFEVGTAGSFVLFSLAAGEGYLLGGVRLKPFILICIACVVLYGAAASAGFGAPHVKPSALSTEIILGSSYGMEVKNILIGIGPGGFVSQWELYRPVESNMSPFWDTQFTRGYSMVATLAVELGLAGVLAFFFWPYLLITDAFAKGRFIRGTLLSTPYTAVFYLAALTLSLFSFALLCFSDPDITVLLFGGVSAGLALGQGAPESVDGKKPRVLIRLFVALACISIGVILVLLSVLQGKALVRSERAGSLEQKDPVAASELWEDALTSWQTPEYARRAARAHLEAAITVTTPAGDAAGTTAHVERAGTLADRSVELNVKDPQSWLNSGALFLSLVLAGVDGYNARARDTLEQARQLMPVNPEPLYLLALLSDFEEDPQGAIGYVEESLRLKPDYEEAKLLERRLVDAMTR